MLVYEVKSVLCIYSVAVCICLQNRGESQPRVAVHGSEPSVSHHSGEYVHGVVITPITSSVSRSTLYILILVGSISLCYLN
jgi:hypothetical protein